MLAISTHLDVFHFFTLACLIAISTHVKRLGGLMVAFLPRVQEFVSSNPDRVKSKTLILVFAASPLYSRHKGVRVKTGRLEG